MGRRRRGRLKRERANRRTPTRIVIVCEGENTERDYFHAIKRRFGRAAVIAIKVVAGVNSPVNVVKRALRERKYERKEKGLCPGDEFWAVFDRDSEDHYYPAIAFCKDNDICAAYSNPCFELWPILHYQEYDRAETPGRTQRDLEEISGGAYSRKRGKTMDFSPLMTHLEEAERRAERQFERRRREAGSDGRLPPPYTTVFQLTRSIREKASADR